jgi:hypothetical protein
MGHMIEFEFTKIWTGKIDEVKKKKLTEFENSTS